MVKAVLTRSLRNSNIRKCRNIGISFDNTGFQEHIYKLALHEVLSGNFSTDAELSYFDDYSGKKITYELGTSLSSIAQIPSVDAALFQYRVKIGDHNPHHMHVKSNVVATDCATNRFKFTALPGFLVQASKFVTVSLKEREILDLCNRMLRVRKKTHLLTSKLSGTALATSSGKSSTLRCSLALQAALKYRVLSISRASRNETRRTVQGRPNQRRGTPQTKTGHTVRYKSQTLNRPLMQWNQP